jgi:hypothetical protein
MDILVAMMRDSSPLAFAEETADNFDIVRKMLSQHVTMEGDLGRKLQGLTAVLGLGIQRGSLSIAGAVQFFLRAVTTPVNPAHPGAWLAIAHPNAMFQGALNFLQQLASFRALESSSLFVRSRALSSKTTPLLPRATAVAEGTGTAAPPLPAHCAVAVNGEGSAFAFVHTARGLMKVGTGTGGSVRGFPYACAATGAGDVASMFFYQERLYMFRPLQRPLPSPAGEAAAAGMFTPSSANPLATEVA